MRKYEDEKLFFIATIILAFILINIFMVVYGIGNEDSACLSPKKRIEYIFPGFRIGCWLGEEVK